MTLLNGMLLYILLLGSQMSELNQKQPLVQDQLRHNLRDLQGAFPQISEVELTQDILTSPHLGRLSRMLQLCIPINAYSKPLQQLHSNISKQYYQQIFKIDHSSPTRISQIGTDSEIPKADLQLQQNPNRSDKAKRVKSKINYLDLANYISSFTTEQETNVSQELIQMGRAFDSWGVKEVASPQLPKHKPQKQDSKKQNSQIKMGRQKSQKTDEIKSQSVTIMLGKNISLECKEMRHEIINRANANRLLEQNTRLTQLQRIAIEINYILNRITQQYLEDFLQELQPYAKDEIYSFILSDKIIEKVMEEHNFIITYSKLVKRLKNVEVLLGGDKLLRFKNIFVEKLQQNFYSLVRHGQWEQKEEIHKKKLLGMSYFIGQLFNIRFLSKYVFTDCFYELVRCYVLQYDKYKGNKSVFYYQTYIECVVKVIEKMNREYDDLLSKKNNSDLESVLNQIIESASQQDYSFTQVCDYIQLLKKINQRLPSQRFKITFLLEDFKCSTALKKEKEALNNNEYEIVKSILSIDINIKQDANKIPEMLSRGRPEVIMKDFYYQFAEGNIKQVNKHINIFKIMTQCPGICDAAVSGLKDNVDGLYSIQSDFPYLCEGLAKVMKIVCDQKRLNYRQLNLGEEDHEDEDIRQFLLKIEEKYYKMIIQD